MKISYEESVFVLAGKLLLYAVKELVLLVMILVVSGIYLGDPRLIICAVIAVLGWVTGYCRGRCDESEVAG